MPNGRSTTASGARRAVSTVMTAVHVERSEVVVVVAVACLRKLDDR
jgi:hypothetical protein